jgi:valyl-tRNA synthetase
MYDEYRFNEAFATLYSFAWSEVFDWFIELSKAPLKDEARAPQAAAAVGVVLRDLLKLFHPAIPFVTEELWSHLVGDGLLATSPWPQPPSYEAPPSMEAFQGLIVAARRFRAEHGLSPKAGLHVVLSDPAGLADPWWEEQAGELAQVTIAMGEQPGDGFTRLLAGSVEAFVALEGVVDTAAERARIETALAAAEDTRSHAAGKLGKESFVSNAPPDVVSKERAKLAEAEQLIGQLRAQLEELG